MCWRRPSSLRRKTSTIWNEDALQSRCPFCVKTGSAYVDPAFPFYPQQQTPVCRSLESVSCQTRKWTVSLYTASAQRCWLHSNAEHPEPLTKHRYRRLGLLLGLVPPPPPPGLRLLPVSNGSFALDRGSGGPLRGGVAMMAGRRTGKDRGVGLGSVGHQSRTFPSRSRQRRFAY